MNAPGVERRASSTGAMPALFAALAKAQAELENAKKNSANPHFRSKYADLAACWETWQEVGPKNGLSVIQLVHDTERQGIILETVLAHSEGGTISSRSFWPAIKADPQMYGSALTYARRYSLSALVGIAPTEDDGNKATEGVRQAQATSDEAEYRAGIEKYKKDAGKLRVIQAEAKKAGLKKIVTEIDELVKGLENGT